MILKNKILSLACLLATSIGASAATYTWTGADGATDATWDNPLNWAGGDAPDGQAGQLSTSSSTDVVVFDSQTASFMPSNFITTRTSFTGSFKNPQIQVLNGQVDFSNGDNWGWSGINSFIVGDGDMTTLAVANTGYSGLNRDPNGLKTYVVNADGTLIFRNNVTAWSYDGSLKTTVVSLVGGTAQFDGTITNHFTNAANNYVSFDAYGSVFNADLGGQLSDEATILGQFGDSFRLGGSLASDPNAALSFTDNGNSTFTVTVIPEPSTALLSALGLLALLRRRR